MGIKTLLLGLDVGSTTVKLALLDTDTDENTAPVLVFGDYRRHHADIRAEMLNMLQELGAAIAQKFGADGATKVRLKVALTGSAGLGVANALGIDFVQEVIAETEAINVYNPESDVIIELGGEDAKITYLKPTPEQRMNGSCAGGTGAFIDQMATLLKTDASGLNQLASEYTKLYPIASRCGVFAKTDLQPLINDGAPAPDLAASIFQAVATQTIAGLACGRPIRGNVVFLGGPLYFLPELRNAFKRALEGKTDNFHTPENAQLYVAIGAALLAGKSGMTDAVSDSSDDLFSSTVGVSQQASDVTDAASADLVEPFVGVAQGQPAGFQTFAIQETSFENGTRFARSNDVPRYPENAPSKSADTNAVADDTGESNEFRSAPHTPLDLSGSGDRELAHKTPATSNRRPTGGDSYVDTATLRSALSPLNDKQPSRVTQSGEDQSPNPWSLVQGRGGEAETPLNDTDANVADDGSQTIQELIAKLSTFRGVSGETGRMNALFADDQAFTEFTERHEKARIETLPIEEVSGAVYLGIDAGSTTIKAVLIDEDANIRYSYYASNEGDPVGRAVEIVKEIREKLPHSAIIARSTVTGYGEGLIKAALHIDEGEVETVAHFTAADYVANGVTSIIDIGGQDMKYLSIKDGVIDSIAVNEACSSGCGSFLQTFAQTMCQDIIDFAGAALESKNPVDLGSRCTVFMNSSVKQAQKEGASIADISAGLSYSVVRNALYKVIKLRDPAELGDKVVVQGGTFLNNAVLRAFEQLTGLEVVRPNISGLMGAYGAALIAKKRYIKGAPSKVLTLLELQSITMDTQIANCGLCPNNCNLTITHFGDGASYVTGNRCERGENGGKAAIQPPASSANAPHTPLDSYGRTGEPHRPLNDTEGTPIQILDSDVENVTPNGSTKSPLNDTNGVDANTQDDELTAPTSFAVKNKKKKSSTLDIPNLFDYKYERTFARKYYKPFTQRDAVTQKRAYRGVIGIPRVLNMYENYPFWFTVLTELGFEVKLSGRSDHKLFESGMDSIASENICYPAKLAHGHIIDLIEKGVDRIFYPCITFEDDLSPEADNNYNCPIVANYPQVIANNIEELRGNRKEAKYPKGSIYREHHKHPEIDFIYPYFSLSKHQHVGERVAQEFERFGVSASEAAAAVEKAYVEDARFKEDVVDEGAKALEFAREHGKRAIVLAGRPYHIDPEVNHGIPQAVQQLDMVVLTEDAASGLYERGVANGEIEELVRPLRVMDQWAYHTRLYKAGGFVAQTSGVQLVQLNSFGCGLDAVTTDQVAEILRAYGDIYTVLKIDEVSNLGAAKIRLRSLAAAADDRERASERGSIEFRSAPHTPLDSYGQTTALRSVHYPLNDTGGESGKLASGSNGKLSVGPDASGQSAAAAAYVNTYGKPRKLFTKEMKKKHTILCPQMAPTHFRLVKGVFERGGYDVQILEVATAEDVEVGLKYVNNDACYPAVMVIGQLVNAFKRGEYDPASTSVIMSQTGGMCRATNYIGLLRMALAGAGYGGVPVLSISTQGLEKHPGFKLGVSELLWALRALVLGDMFQDLLFRVRPYAVRQSDVEEVYEHWNKVAVDWIAGRKHYSFKKLVRNAVRAFDDIELQNIPRKPRVGVVGEILVKFHPDANNHVIDVIEREGCEAVMPGIFEFMTNKLFIAKWNWDNISRGTKSGVFFKPIAGWFTQKFCEPVAKAYTDANNRANVPERQRQYKNGELLPKFDLWTDMNDVVKHASTVTSIGVQAGEGWLLAGEIVELIHRGAPNIVCANPFACLPNHVTGRGIFQEIRRQHPEANIVSIDYDPGASEVNQLNRIKLMISAAKTAESAKV